MGFVVATAWGTLGDVLPFLAVGAELRKRGHEVTLIANPAFEPQAREAGVTFVGVGTAEQHHAMMADPGVWDRNTHVTTTVKHLLPTVQGFYEAVARVHRAGETILIASRPGPWIAAEQLGIPCVTFMLSPGGLSRLDPMHPSRPLPVWANVVARSRWGLRLLQQAKSRLGSLQAAIRGPAPVSGSIGRLLTEVQRVRALAGLPARPASQTAQLKLLIGLWPRWFSPPQKDWPPLAKVSGFPFYPKPPAPPVDQSGKDRGPRAIVFTRGSGACAQRSFFAAAVECCRLLERPGILVTPHAADVPSELPPTVSHVPFADFGELFTRAAAVAHHGGVGTLAYAFAAGIPQVVMPIVGDQFDLGYRMERLGVGAMLTKTPLAPARLARKLDSLCRSERVRRRCAELRDQVDPEAGSSLAADWIEELLASLPSTPGRRAVRAGPAPTDASSP